MILPPRRPRRHTGRYTIAVLSGFIELIYIYSIIYLPRKHAPQDLRKSGECPATRLGFTTSARSRWRRRDDTTIPREHATARVTAATIHHAENKFDTFRPLPHLCFG